ncbi:MAG: hypothetical protein MRY83_14435 [Flavobacteriales bacterium]|nr:hypothetical protein [Flavobacteriales bacterium]
MRFILIVILFLTNLALNAQIERFITRENMGYEYKQAIKKDYSNYPLKIKLMLYNPDEVSFPFLIQEEIITDSLRTYFELAYVNTDNPKRSFDSNIDFWSLAIQERTETEMFYYIFYHVDDSTKMEKIELKGDLLLFDEYRRYPHQKLPIADWEKINGVQLVPLSNQQ